MLPIGDAIQKHLDLVSGKLFTQEARANYSDVKMLILLRRHVEWLQSELRPLAKLIKALEEKVRDEELRRYLEDVEDALTT